MNFQVHLFAAAIVLSNCLSSAVAEDFDIKPLQEDVLKTVEKVSPAVVSIGSGGSLFSGVIVSKDGHVLSAGHAVNPGSRYRIRLPDGRRFSGIGKGVKVVRSLKVLKCGVQFVNVRNIAMIGILPSIVSFEWIQCR